MASSKFAPAQNIFDGVPKRDTGSNRAFVRDSIGENPLKLHGNKEALPGFFDSAQPSKAMNSFTDALCS